MKRTRTMMTMISWRSYQQANSMLYVYGYVAYSRGFWIVYMVHAMVISFQAITFVSG